MTLLLLRHGFAGHRRPGDDDDHLRPLDELGRRQAESYPELYAGFSVEGGRMSKTLLPDQANGFITSGAIFLGIDSPIGPFYLAWGRSSDGAKSAYVFLGRP